MSTSEAAPRVALHFDAQSKADWAPLGYFCIYRVLIALTFVAINWMASSPRVLGDVLPLLFERTALAYFLCAIAFA